MKRILVIFCLLISIEAYSQTSIAGVLFGESYDKTAEALKAKFGEPDAANNKEITYIDTYYADFYFDLIIFGFQRDENNSYLNSCILLKSFEYANEAKKYRDEIAQELMSQYKLIKVVGDNKFTCYYGGTDPTENDKYGFCLEILSPTSLVKFYGVRLFYGPFNFLKEKF